MDKLCAENEALKANLLSNETLQHLEKTAKAGKSLMPEMENLILKSQPVLEKSNVVPVEDNAGKGNWEAVGTTVENLGASKKGPGKII